MATQNINRRSILISGKSASGKSASLRNIKNPAGVLFCNCDAGKDLPMPAKFRMLTVTDPYQVWDAFDKAEQSTKIHTIAVDTITFMMAMFESVHVLTATNTMKAWGNYAQFWKVLMLEKVANSTKNVIMLGHTMNELNDNEGIMETLVKVKGSVMNEGIESYFPVVVSTKKMPLQKLDAYKNLYLNITPEEEAVGFKYVFQTNLTKETVNERIRSPMGLWNLNESFIDNDAQFLIDKLDEYYK
jgi:hypothetical protein